MESGYNDRQYWMKIMLDIVSPVLKSLSERRLKQTMPVELSDPKRDASCTYLEALGRSLAGISSWLESGEAQGEEGMLRAQYAAMARAAIDAATDPASPDYMDFGQGFQTIVDTSFLSHAIVRAPSQLLEKLDPQVRVNLAAALKATRSRKPYFNNWLLFSAMTETALYLMGEDWDPMRIDYALKQHEQWYVGDGTYSDGPEYHADYYNSFVIHPMMLDIVNTIGHQYGEWDQLRENVLSRAKRYAEIQERMISPEGTFPPIGRSLAYRFGAFQLLAQMSLREQLPDGVHPAQVRCALTAVIRRVMDMPGTYDAGGWLTIGLCGHQPTLGERYITTGSLYLCSTVFLPLGLKANAAFWHEEPADWTAKKLWSGREAPIDQALKL
jgi:hypothetical protein